MRAKVRLFVVDPLAAGVERVLEGDRAHYLGRVMRLGEGDPLRLFNGVDGEWLARIVAAGRGVVRIRAETRLRAQQVEIGPWLLFAPLKKDAQDFLVEKATELGVEALLPVATRFTSVGRVNLARLRAQVIEAAEQSGRLDVPVVEALVSLQALLVAWPSDRLLLFLDERGGGRPIADVAIAAHAAGGPARPAPGILVGPEGGFAADEAVLIASIPGALPVSLGPRILRAETAAIAALACWQAFAGDWRPANDSGI